LYRKTITKVGSTALVFEPKDRAWVFLDGKYIGVLQRGKDTQITIPSGAQLDILVENMGRVNYGRYINDPKGIPNGVLFQGQFLNDWESFPLSLKDLSPLRFGPYVNGTGPSFFRGVFTVPGDRPYDTYLVADGWSKGNAFVNGFNVGRYWKVGPQYSLYIPAAVLRTGENEIIIFELESATSSFVTLQNSPKLKAD